MEATKRKGKKIGWRLNKKGKRNLELTVIVLTAFATIGYIIGGSWLLWAIVKAGVSM